MVWLLAPLVVIGAVASTIWVVSAIATIRAEQTQRGLFGAAASERLVQQWTDVVIGSAERLVRLGHFDATLRSVAWTGTLSRIERQAGGRTRWQFASGDVWDVDLASPPPRPVRRVVVHHVDAEPSGMVVRAYIPNRRTLQLHVLDAEVVETSGG